MRPLSIFGIAWLQHRYLVAALAIALAGCAAGFLRSNFHPARIYMGDAGSLFLGFTISVLLLTLRANAPTRVGVAVILAIPGVALFDTTLVMVSRVIHKRNPFNGGQDHTSHRLVYLGLSVRKAVALTYLVAAALGGAAIAMTQAPSARLVGVAVLLGVAAVAAVPLYRVPVYKVPWADAKGRRLSSLPRRGDGASPGRQWWPRERWPRQPRLSNVHSQHPGRRPRLDICGSGSLRDRFFSRLRVLRS